MKRTAILVFIGILLVVGGCSFGKKTANNMAITADYENEKLKKLNVECGRDRDVQNTIDKAVIK